MFALHTSNRSENLLQHLAQVIETQPLGSPFSKEIFLIQSQGMERWISQQLATHFGVWGNYQFYFPGNFFSEISNLFVADEKGTSYQREQMVWIFEQQRA
ncbi:MAG: exodeoxyribonuclease V subunit gamma, partial [Chromatiales bacterium]|nr:exodeoxyribonuclease V subunit gamma [Chromatiales bacterium]